MKTDFEKLETEFKGMNTKRDVSKVGKGVAVSGQNVIITDGDLIASRSGYELLGSAGSSLPITASHVFRKRDGSEIPMRTYGTVIEYYNDETAAWENLMTGLTSGARMGFADHNVNTDSIDLVYFGNGYEPLTRWEGEFTKLNGALAGGGETTLTVTTTLKDEVYYSGTVSSATATTIDIATSAWTTDLWNDFYVYITSGTHANKVRKISATDANTITFTTTTTAVSAGDTFEIRLLKFPIPAAGSNTLRIGHSTPYNLTYTDIPTSTTITCAANTTAVADGAAVTYYVTQYTAAPRCSHLRVLHTRMFGTGNLKSPSSVYYSAVADATDWTYASPRTEGEGGVIDTPEGGGKITGFEVHEDKCYIFKRDIIKTVEFTQGGATGQNDIPIIKPLIESPAIGPQSFDSVFKAINDIFFISVKGGVRSIKRIEGNDTLPLSEDVADPIKPTMNTLTFTSACGHIFDDKIYVSARSSGAEANDIIYVFNINKKVWELPIVGWNASTFFVYSSYLHFGSSLNNSTFKCLTGTADDGAGYLCRWTSGEENYGKPANRKELSAVYVEGYLSESTALTIRVRFGYQGGTKTIETSLNGSGQTYLLSPVLDNVLGVQALGIWPLGSTGEEESDLKRFRVYLTTLKLPFYEYSIEFESDGVGQQWMILNYGTNAEIIEQIDFNNLKKAFI